VKLITDLKKKVELDGQVEQQDYNTYACWCEQTMASKAKDIADSKDLIAESEILIKKLEGEIASHGAEVEQLSKDIAKNKASQDEAAEVRAKAHAEYAEERSENEQCIGALEAAIKVLTGAGAKKSFLDSSTHKAQVMSVAAQLRSVLHRKAFAQTVEEKDLEVVKHFAATPEAFWSSGTSAMSATQLGQNPFGDYAPQSTQIQGILKGMYDSFTADLEKDNVEEAESEKAYRSLEATKIEEMKTLQSSKSAQKTNQAEKTKTLRDTEGNKMNAAKQLEADEKFFEDTKEACQVKAGQWSVRVRLRSEELMGMAQAIKILSSGDATFKNATAASFLQFSAVEKHLTSSSAAKKAFGRLKKIATKHKSIQMAEIASAVQMGSPFAKVISMIDDMMALLREEEAADIRHRDLCEDSLSEYTNEKGDADIAQDKVIKRHARLNRTKTELNNDIAKLEQEMNATTTDMDSLRNMRNKEHSEFAAAVKHDTEAVALIREAIIALDKFYKNNKIALELTQKAPEYTSDDLEAPSTSWSGSDYGGRKSETSGIIEILTMLAEDLTKEIADARADEAEDEKDYDKQAGALQKMYESKDATKVGLEDELASVEDDIDDAEDEISDQGALSSNTAKAKANLKADCMWVKTHFQKRKDDREDEMQGLVDAKSFLAGVDAGEDPLPPSM